MNYFQRVLLYSWVDSSFFRGSIRATEKLFFDLSCQNLINAMDGRCYNFSFLLDGMTALALIAKFDDRFLCRSISKRRLPRSIMLHSRQASAHPIGPHERLSHSPHWIGILFGILMGEADTSLPRWSFHHYDKIIKKGINFISLQSSYCIISFFMLELCYLRSFSLVVLFALFGCVDGPPWSISK